MRIAAQCIITILINTEYELCNQNIHCRSLVVYLIHRWMLNGCLNRCILYICTLRSGIYIYTSCCQFCWGQFLNNNTPHWILEWVYAVSAATAFTVCPGCSFTVCPGCSFTVCPGCSFTVWTVYILHPQYIIQSFPPPSTPTPCVTRFRHQVSVLRDQSAGQREFGFNNGGTLSIRVRRSHLLQDGLDLLKNVRPHCGIFSGWLRGWEEGLCMNVCMSRAGAGCVITVWSVIE